MKCAKIMATILYMISALYGGTCFSKDKFKVVYVYDFYEAGSGFNKSAADGIKKARSELDIELIEIKDLSGVKRTKKIIEDTIAKGADLLVSLGFRTNNIAAEVAKKHVGKTDLKFAVIDTVINLPNVASYVFKEHEGSFLAGYMAAKFSKSGKIGYIGGMPIPPLKRFEAGYLQGAKYANKNIDVMVTYLDPTTKNHTIWGNKNKAKKVARGLYSKGADIVYSVAGGGGMGIFNAAKEVKKYAIGVDVNENHKVPGHIITSMVKRVDTATFRAIKDAVEGKKMSGKTTVLGVVEEGVGLALDDYSQQIVGKSFIDDVKEIHKKIARKEIKVSDSN